jgi:hypothetical protein
MGVLTKRLHGRRQQFTGGWQLRSPMVLLGILWELSRVRRGWNFLGRQGDGAELQRIFGSSSSTNVGITFADGRPKQRHSAVAYE